MSVNMKAQTLIVNCEATLIPSGHSAGEHINPATRETERLTTHADTEQHGCREPQVWSERRCSGETWVRHKIQNTTILHKLTVALLHSANQGRGQIGLHILWLHMSPQV